MPINGSDRHGRSQKILKEGDSVRPPLLSSTLLLIIIIIDTFIKRHKCLGYRGASPPFPLNPARETGGAV